MSTIKSSAENLTLNADGANNDIKFQSNGSEVAAIDQAGNLTVSGTVDGVDVAARDGVLTSTTATAAAALPKAGGTMSGNLVVSGDIDMTGVLNGTAGSMDIKNEANNENIFLKVTGSGSEVTALKIHSNGVLELPSGGLRVGGTATVNTLDDYETGSATPSGTNISSSSNIYQYIKIGDMCWVQGWITATGGNSSNAIGGLPFTAVGLGNAQGGGTPLFVNADITGLYVTGNSTSFTMYGGSSRTDQTPLGSGNQMHFVLQYRTT